MWDSDPPQNVTDMLGHFSRVQLLATSWTVACQASAYGILQARILE